MGESLEDDRLVCFVVGIPGCGKSLTLHCGLSLKLQIQLVYLRATQTAPDFSRRFIDFRAAEGSPLDNEHKALPN